MDAEERRRHKQRHRIHKSKKQKLDGFRNEINVTPLVDVCLVLLIIFMVVAPLLQRGKQVPLPKTRHHTTAKDKGQPIVVIGGDGKLYVGQDPVPNLAAMKKRVEQKWDSEGAKAVHQVLLKADKNVHYGKVYPVVMAIHSLGLSSIDLGTNEKKQNKD